jgi:hypothetical protein
MFSENTGGPNTLKLMWCHILEGREQYLTAENKMT